jgi:hypothetical protein
MLISPVVLNSIIGDEKHPTFTIIYFSDNVCAVECVGKPNSVDEESYWIFFDNLPEAAQAFGRIKYGNWTPVYQSGKILVGSYSFNKIAVTIG